MDTACTLRKCELTSSALDHLARAVKDLADDSSRPPVRAVTPSELVGHGNVTSLTLALLQCVGAAAMSIRSWHVFLAERLSKKPQMAKDIMPEEQPSAVCVLVCISGQGEVKFARSEGKPVAQMHAVRLLLGDCAVYRCNSIYTVVNTSAAYLHCVCAHEGTDTRAVVHHPVKFLCPYNPTIQLGDVRHFPRNYQPSTAGGCNYRGATWKNVLDHLHFCSTNPRRDECRERREERRAKVEVLVQCDQCDHKPFTLKNSLVQHKARKHRSPAAPVSQLPAGRSELVEDEDDEDYDWFLSPLPRGDGEPIREPKLKRRRPRNASLSVRGAGQPSLLDKFNDFLASTPHPVFQALEPHTEEVTYALVGRMLEGISRSDVRQPSGRSEFNVGEMTPDAVTAILGAFGAVRVDDVFVDIGAGVGNVALQMALQSRFSLSLGVEIREDLVMMTKTILEKHNLEDPRLAKVLVVASDITQQEVVDLPHANHVTHIFSHNTLFVEDAVHAVERSCWLPMVRRIALTKKPCSRHRVSCPKDFCKLMALESTIRVPVTYTDSLVDVYIYRKLAIAI